MHEMALAESLLAIVERTALGHDAKEVRGVRLELGALAQVEIEALRTCFDVVKRHSLAEHACLEILCTPGEAWCMECSKRVPVAERGTGCPECGSHQLQVTQGTEMRVRDIEVV